jgi:hypothetical protein
MAIRSTTEGSIMFGPIPVPVLVTDKTGIAFIIAAEFAALYAGSFEAMSN